jgi:hypothetical protein
MAEYKQPKSVAVPASSGYPNKVADTQTKKIRGAGAASRGNKYNPKPG